MALNLIRRLIKGSPLTAQEHDGNLNKLEDAIEERELAGAAEDAVAAHADAADPHPGYLTGTEANAAYAALGAPAAAVAAHEQAADPHPGYLTQSEGDARYAPLGSTGGGVSAYVHTQSTPATTWTINHNLGYRPSVELFNSGMQEIDAEIAHPSVNQTVVTLNPATAGLARLI
jgi:hypothetical protein